MSNVSATGADHAQLTETMLGGKQAMTDQAMKMVQVATEAKVGAQQQQNTMAAVAMMTGVGAKVDTVA